MPPSGVLDKRRMARSCRLQCNNNELRGKSVRYEGEKEGKR